MNGRFQLNEKRTDDLLLRVRYSVSPSCLLKKQNDDVQYSTTDQLQYWDLLYCQPRERSKNKSNYRKEDSTPVMYKLKVLEYCTYSNPIQVEVTFLIPRNHIIEAWKHS